MPHARNRRLVVACCGTPLLASPAGFAASETQYTINVLDANGIAAAAIDHGRAGGFDHTTKPTIWSSDGTSVSHLPLPAGYNGAEVTAISGPYAATNVTDQMGLTHGLLWDGTASMPLDLGQSTAINGLYNGVAVGAINSGALNRHAAVFFPYPIDLNPSSSVLSIASGIWGTEVSGSWYQNPRGGDAHAAMWTSLSPSGFVDLSQTAFTQSEALAVSRGQVVGWVWLTAAGSAHAALWTNSAASFQDLAPMGTTASFLTATNGIQQVGRVSLQPGINGASPLDSHATVWGGTANSFQLLPVPQGDNYSVANGIDGAGNIAGWAGQEIGNGGVQLLVPIVWVPYRLPGDANFDGTVGYDDLLILAQHYGQAGEWVDGEFSGGGTVDFADLLTLAQNYGKTQAAVDYSVVAVPEASAILAACVLGLIPRRRR